MEEQRNLDKNPSAPTSKFFHNKITATINHVSLSYASTLNPRFLLEILGPLGLTLSVISSLKIIKNPKSIYTLGLAAVAITSLLLILPIDPRKTFYMAALAHFSFSTMSASYFAKTKLHLLIFLILLIASFWYFALSWQMTAICNEIFFN